MKKLVIAVLACAGLMAPAQGQDKVSLNTVGYIRNVSNPGLHIAALQLEVPTNTVQAVYGDTMPQGTRIYRFDSGGGGYSISTYGRVFVPATASFVVKWSTSIDLINGEGFWVRLPDGAETTTNLFLGEVPSADSITNVLVEGLSLVSYPYPVDRVVTNLGIVPIRGDTIYVFDAGRGGYDSTVYGNVFVPTVGLVVKWDSPGMVIKAGTGFWYQTAVENTWVATKAFLTN